MAFEFEPGRFYQVDQQGHLLAEVTYQPIKDGAVYALDHTFVDPSLRGQGVAHQLVAAVVELARREGKQILPLCPYAKKEFDRLADYADVYYKNPEGAQYEQ